jgi:histidine decarboxylase
MYLSDHTFSKKNLIPSQIDKQLSDLNIKFVGTRANHIGYPYNLDFETNSLSHLGGFLVNNLGDPYVGSHYATEVCDMERETIAWMMGIWGCQEQDEHWGAVGTSGTEGNLWAIYLAREALEQPILITSAEAHYSLPKAARILNMDSANCAADATGAISVESLRDAVRAHRDRNIILALTCGTTMKGAHDDITGCIKVLDEEGIDPSRRFVHVDGALNAMVLPFIDGVPDNICPTFGKPIDSISASGHKMIGTPMPCGVLVTKRTHVSRVASAISYLRSDDTTLMGSRNGHAVLAIWNRLMRHGVVGFRKDSKGCIERAGNLADRLKSAGIPVLHNSWSLTVVFPKPSEAIINAYQLACHDDSAHAIVMPNVKRDLIDRFVVEYIADWRSRTSREAPL